MAFEITPRNQEQATTMRADRMLWVAADGKTIVEHGDMSAAVLLAGPGKMISDVEVEKFGLVVDDGRVSQSVPEPPKVEEPEVKELPKPEDKALAKPATKAVTKKATKKRTTKRRKKRSG